MAIKDRYPQFLRLEVAETTVNTYRQLEIDCPFDLEEGIGINILKVFYNVGKLTLDAGLAHNSLNIQIARSSQTAILSFSDPDLVVPKFVRNFYQDGAVLTDGFTDDPVMYDLSDGGGNGILFVGPKLYVGVKGEALDAVGQGAVIIEYTLVKVPTKEILGMLSG